MCGGGGGGRGHVRMAAMGGAYAMVVGEPDRVKRRKAEIFGANIGFEPGELETKARFDAVIETSGKETASRVGFALTRAGGRFVGVGVPEPLAATIGVDLIHRDRYKELLGEPILH